MVGFAAEKSDSNHQIVNEIPEGNFYIATDSEWDKSRDEPWLSTAFDSPAGTVIYFTQDIDDVTRSRLERAAVVQGVTLAFTERRDDTSLLGDYFLRTGQSAKEIYLVMFYSAKDIEYACGWDAVKDAIETGKLRQRNNLSGAMEGPDGCNVRIKDLCGWSGKSSLKKFGNSLGIDMGDKGVMDPYKACMYTGLVEKPEDFLRYSVSDVVVLRNIHNRFVELIRNLQRECLGMAGDDLWDSETIPMTTGALVAVTLERWTYNRSSDRDAFKFAMRKLGILDPGDRRYKFSIASFLHLTRSIRTMEDFRKARDNPSAYYKQIFAAKFLSTCMDAGSVKCWAGRSVDDSAGFNALVQGGRCTSEDPFRYRMDRAADIDITGCYGEAMRSTVYPLGLPRVWSHTPNQEPVKFGDWLDEMERKLVPGLWTATVSGSLSFEQDLIYSKIVKPGDIRKSMYRDDDADGDIPSDFALLRRQIINGILTHDLLDLIRKVATNSEWAEIRELDLVTAAAYLESDRLDDISEWTEVVIADRGYYHMRRGTLADTRSRAWTAIPMEGFIGNLADRRKFYKKISQSASTEQERTDAAGMSEMLKLFVNTTYGVMASRYFRIGNTVVANGITARGRMGVWMLAKALMLRQTITDGGAYVPDQVGHYDPTGRKPGLATFARVWEWHAPNRRRWVRPLPKAPSWDRPMATDDGDWGDDARRCRAEWDAAALDHVRSFWAPYGITFPFNLLHKCLVERGAYWSKADYAFIRQGESEPTYKLRGKARRKDCLPHPFYEMFRNILDGVDEMPADLEYDKSSLLKIGKYNIIQASHGYMKLKHIRPGDECVFHHSARFNNIWMPLTDEKDYQARKNRKQRHRGLAVEWFERYRHDGIHETHRHMVENDLRTQPKLSLV